MSFVETKEFMVTIVKLIRSAVLGMAYCAICLLLIFGGETARSEVVSNQDGGDKNALGGMYSTLHYQKILCTPNGAFYSYIVLLFYENPHFVNIAYEYDLDFQESDLVAAAYASFLETIDPDDPRRDAAFDLYELYNFPSHFTTERVHELEKKLEEFSVILEFTRSDGMYELDYCILGKRETIPQKHPFLSYDDTIYNIVPLIYYDEFHSSNATFYNDLVYIDLNEVENDTMIAQKVLNDEDTEGLYYAGSRVTEAIKSCIKKSTVTRSDIKNAVLDMFIVHELTHKILQSKYGYYHRINEEEFAMVSTVYDNPYLGISVMYSYLNYYRQSPHRIAALRFVRYIAKKEKNSQLFYNPDDIRNLPAARLKEYAQLYFRLRMKQEGISNKND